MPAIAPFHPDPLAPEGLTTYIFGFRNLTGLGYSEAQVKQIASEYKVQDGPNDAGDLTADDITDGADLAIVLGHWGPCPS